MKRLAIHLIHWYQVVTRALPAQHLLLVPSGCRSYPTCSDYTIRAVQDRGVVRGMWAGLVRLAHCHA